MFLTRGVLERFLALLLSEPFRYSHLRYFLLLRHFVLNFASPSHKGNFNSDIKTYRKGEQVFVLFVTLCGVLCSAETLAPFLCRLSLFYLEQLVSFVYMFVFQLSAPFQSEWRSSFAVTILSKFSQISRRSSVIMSGCWWISRKSCSE